MSPLFMSRARIRKEVFSENQRIIFLDKADLSGHLLRLDITKAFPAQAGPIDISYEDNRRLTRVTNCFFK